ncbi:MAG: iron-containing alcohol dehydrogenase family protein [Chitinispirillales bacterium]|jgi:glycerol-1-phosphate dehydrogenase [NAD(P)+]|nr:iron-containing alcohol dehydrogenase family protein [Chitinispirillales bacterium]
MEIQVPELLRIKPKALFKLGKYLSQSGYSRIAFFWGTNIKKMYWDAIDISLSTADIRVIFEIEVSSNDMDTAFKTVKELPQNVDAIVAIGGGTAVDYGKYVAFNRQLPLFCVPTLISNDAFASPTSSLVVDGKRKSVKTHVPQAIIIDTEVISATPKQFLYSGIGDLFCKTTAVFDYKFAYKKRGEPVNDFAATIAKNAVDTFSFFNDKRFDNYEYIGILASSLLMTGIAMIIAGSSRPSSGSEHLISHAYDRVAQNPTLHGIQVGVASYAVSYLQEATYERLKKDIIGSGFYDFVKENPLNKDDFIKAVMLAPDIKEDYYTILSEKGNIRRLEEFVNTDEMMCNMLK